ncbi:MAG: tRNA (N(6)-L-threonylcarbamoyladenosine(37)-C(2))-methylthiotransferase MtaB [Dehalococcoidales bacterium]|nr:tRNA (N(6)-L-threonylcarbamoyladenosine(37)-C(2))-methylthiotransferase MtaB [Dehalococcoidales bacterium]
MKNIRKIRVALETLGCKVNQAETEKLARQFIAAGYRLVPADTEADIYVLNTCTVTHIADRKSRHWLRTAHRRNPDALLVATGCYAEHAVKELSQIEGVRLVVGNTDKPRLVEIIENNLSPNSMGKQHTVTVHPLSGTALSRNDIELTEGMFRTRTFIKVQDGCHNFCSYCIVPFVRNRETSLPAGQVITEITVRQAEGFKEIVITGVEAGSYNDNGTDLTGLLKIVLAETAIERIRLSSLQPPEITEDLLELWQNPRLCRHFHLALQSGSDGVLKRMHRCYTTADYASAVSLIRACIPDAAITTDIIVGFPGETEQEFEEGFEFCRRMEFARIHVFPYSVRKGTKAADFPDQVDDKTKKQRTDKMLALANECIRNFSRKFIGKTMPVLFEQKEYNLWSGLTDNYIRVYSQSEEDLTNRILAIKLKSVFRDGVSGVL